MKKHLYFISVLGLLVLNGCSSDCNAFDYPPDHSVTLDAKTIEKYTIEDLSQGTGRMAQDGRRMEIQVEIKDEQNNVLTQSVMNYEYPAAESYYNGPQVHGLPYPGNYPIGMAKAIMGMKEGGVRRFTLNEWKPIHGYAGTNKAFQEKATRYLNSAHPSAQIMESNKKGPMYFEVKLLKVCRPVYCLQTTFSIPASRDKKVIEKGCK